MFIARVTGEVVATIKHAALAARKQLLVVPINPATRVESGAPLIALDFVDAGLGDTVLIVDEGNAAALVTGMANPPIRTMILGVVDEIQFGPVT